MYVGMYNSVFISLHIKQNTRGIFVVVDSTNNILIIGGMEESITIYNWRTGDKICSENIQSIKIINFLELKKSGFS